MLRITFALGLALCLVPAYGKHEPVLCGSHDYRARQELQLHTQSAKSGIKRVRASAVSTLRPDQGSIAILDDTNGVISRRNPFSLNQRTLRFVPRPGTPAGYRFELSGESMDTAAAAAGTHLTGLGDDDTRAVPIPFAFPFFGITWTELFVNSDGNVSFGDGDAGVTDRSLGRFLAGSARIAALFEDLDPSRATAGGGVFVTASSDKFVISWVRVPEYSDFGAGRRQTFQLRLFRDGSIEIAWADVVASEAVVGVSVGGVQSDPNILSFTTTSSGDYAGSIAEYFTSTESVDIFAASQRFYQNHEDAYDYLVLFNNLNIQADSVRSALAFEVTVRNDRSGFGDQKVDIGAETGSKRRLQAILNMGRFDDYPVDPDGTVTLRLPSPDTPKTILAHEAGHLFLAYASVRDDEGVSEFPMLGLQSAHWATTFNSEASLMSGARIRDNGATSNPRFTTVAAVEAYSLLDQYLMGFRPAEEVPDTFYVAAASSTAPRFLPQVGVGFNGQRRNVGIADVIAQVGRRTPDHTVAQRRFRFGFALITAAGTTPSATDLARLENYRTAFETFYRDASSQRASADATLKKSLAVSSWPAVGLTPGGTAPIRIATEKPVETSLTVVVRSTGGAAVPAVSSVTIPAGGMEATFQLRALRAGADTILLEPADPGYETVELKAGITAADSQKLAVLSGAGQAATAGTALREAVRVRLTDANELPFPGVSLTASLTGGGSVDNASSVTDEKGVAQFRWTPGSGSVQELRITAPAVTPAVVTALARPALNATSVVNAASFAPGMAPGAIATAFGTSLGSGTADSVQVLVNGLPARVFYANSGQVNFLVPQNVSGGSSAGLVIRNIAGSSDPILVPVSDVQPGIFFDAPTRYGAVVVAGTGSVTQVRPAQRGDVVEIYATGLGLTSAGSGGLQFTRVTPEVTVGGVPAEVLYSGLAPGYPGLYQINARIPASTATGTQTLLLSAAGQPSNEVRIEVR